MRIKTHVVSFNIDMAMHNVHVTHGTMLLHLLRGLKCLLMLVSKVIKSRRIAQEISIISCTLYVATMKVFMVEIHSLYVVHS